MAENYTTRQERRKQTDIQKKGSKGKKKSAGIFKKILMFILIIGIVGVIGVGSVSAYWVSQAPKIDESLLIDPVSSKIYDVNGELLTEEGIENRDYVEYEEIPEQVRNAFLATEDNRFFEHGGVDILRLGSAVISNFTDGFGSQGASTITQQVVKRSFLSDDKTIKRKVQEAWLAIQLEQQYTKEEIFEMYVNKIFFANRANGIATAADTYYGKDLSELELHETAMLVGLPQSPSRYNPYKYPERAEERRNIVLQLMNRHGYITETEMTEAQAIPVEGSLQPLDTSQVDTTPYDAFIDQVIEEVESMGDYNVFTDGLEIYTTIDKDAQEYVFEILNGDEIISYPSESLQAGITLIDTKTGEIRAIGGGRNTTVKRGFNYATEAKRQPGSVIKPIIDYAPAIEHLNWSTYEQILDEEYTYSDGKTPIRNAGGRHRGYVSMREALERSLNVPALKALQAVGIEEGHEFAAELGIPVGDRDTWYESGSIGGSFLVSSLDIAGAFSAFGNSGIYNEPHTVTKIVLRDKTEIKNNFETKAAMKESTAFMISDMLKGAVTKSYGTARLAEVPGLPMAAKTGSTNFTAEDKEKYNFPAEAVKDSWMAAYTTDYTMAVWAGYDSNTEYLGSDSQRIPKYIVKNVMEYVSRDKEPADFKQPNSVVELGIVKGSNPAEIASKYSPESQITYEYFVKGEQPTKVSTVYDKLDAPSGVNATYNEEANEIQLNWSYNDNAQFEVKVSIDGGASSVLSLSENIGLSLQNPVAGSKYSFTVTAIADGQKSDPASSSVTIPGGQSEELPPEEVPEELPEEEPSDVPEIPGLPSDNLDGDGTNPEPENPENPNDGTNNGNGNTNGNTNGNGETPADGNNGNNGNGNGNGGNGEGESQTEPPATEPPATEPPADEESGT